VRIRFGKRWLGPGHPVCIVAELSANHNGSLARALETIDAAAEAGADCVKLQTYKPETMTINSDRPEFVINTPGPWQGRTLFDLYGEAHTPWEWHPKLFERARGRGLEVFSSPFDDTAVDFLETLDPAAYKVASFELVDDALLRKIAATGRPIVLSTGMATRQEVEHAVKVLRDGGATDLILLRCTSSYPAPDDSLRLRTLPLLGKLTDGLVGLSDHSLGTVAAVVAVALGASMVEKHLTLSRADGGVDAHFSLEPAEFAALTTDVRRAEVMLGEPGFGPGAAEVANASFRRSLFTAQDIDAGELFSERNIRSIRPGFGLAPAELPNVLGKRASVRLERGTPLAWDHIAR
jgi:pseudaminic acid synthase